MKIFFLDGVVLYPLICSARLFWAIYLLSSSCLLLTTFMMLGSRPTTLSYWLRYWLGIWSWASLVLRAFCDWLLLLLFLSSAKLLYCQREESVAPATRAPFLCFSLPEFGRGVCYRFLRRLGTKYLVAVNFSSTSALGNNSYDELFIYVYPTPAASAIVEKTVLAAAADAPVLKLLLATLLRYYFFFSRTVLTLDIGVPPPSPAGAIVAKALSTPLFYSYF